MVTENTKVNELSKLEHQINELLRKAATDGLSRVEKDALRELINGKKRLINADEGH